ncbi:IS1595 family transposase [Spirosoma luteum]|uniref:IS1595 family transposase n=1 Tax=Spirosoma luteum TaxID=431553 RepID=UPI00036EA882|nr:IS1595 family transposase [Spirosoma luteum]
MAAKSTTPKLTLENLNERFPDELSCKRYIAKLRWNGQPVCPHCGNKKKSYAFSNGDYKCATCRKHYTVRIGTIFEDSKVPLKKWLIAAYLITAHKKGISSHQLGRDLDVTQRTAWFMLHRLKHAMKTRTFDVPLEGVVEADETYVGGKERFKHKSKRTEGTQGRSTKVKAPVFGMVQRGGRIVAMTVETTSASTLLPIIEEHVAVGSKIMTDEFKAYMQLQRLYQHGVVRHGQGQYKSGEAHTNTLEGFWSLFKRGVTGIYHWVSVKHLGAYVAEFEYRYNSRKISDGDRFERAVGHLDGRLSYKVLTQQD